MSATSADCMGSHTRSIEFKVNETSRNVTACTVVNDRTVENDKIFRVRLFGVNSNVRPRKSEITVTIRSDDGESRVGSIPWEEERVESTRGKGLERNEETRSLGTMEEGHKFVSINPY